MTDLTRDSVKRRRALNIDVARDREARLLVRPIMKQVHRWQLEGQLLRTIGLTGRGTDLHLVRAMTLIDDVAAASAQLDLILESASPAMRAHGRTADITKALESCRRVAGEALLSLRSRATELPDWQQPIFVPARTELEARHDAS